MKKLHYFFSIVLIAVALFFFFYADTFQTLPGQKDIGPAAFPKFICICLIICAVLLVIQQAGDKSGEQDVRLFSWKWLIGVLTAFGFFLALKPVGFVITAIVAVFIMECLLLNEPFKKALPLITIVAVAVPVAVQIIFGQFLKVPLPTGILSGIFG